MDEMRIDEELREFDSCLLDLSRRVEINPRHKAQLRGELLRRHRERTVRRAHRPAFRLWHHLGGLKRLTLVAPPALAVAVAFSALLWGLQVSGHQKTQTAEAQIVSAFARTAPYVVAWDFTVNQERDGKSQVVPYRAKIGKDELLAFYYGNPYLYSNHTWFQVTWPTAELAGPMTANNWRLAFAVFPSLLKERGVVSVPGTQIRGQETEAWTYSLQAADGEQVMVTAWVQRTSGLVLRMDREITHGSQVIERDMVDYTYHMRGK